MSGQLVVVDLAYAGRHGGQGSQSGFTGLRSLLKYFEFRAGSLSGEGADHWVDCGMGTDWRNIVKQCAQFGSKDVLAWTMVISPSPHIMARVPEAQRGAVLQTLTHYLVESYYAERGAETPEYSFTTHSRHTAPGKDGSMLQMHTHVILPGTVPRFEGGREAFYNYAKKGHFSTLHRVAGESFEYALDCHIGHEWREWLREPTPSRSPLRDIEF
jgi:hypothetical protein